MPACLPPECQLHEIKKFILAVTLHLGPSTRVECGSDGDFSERAESFQEGSGALSPERVESGKRRRQHRLMQELMQQQTQTESQSSINKVLLAHKCTVIYALSMELSNHNSRVNKSLPQRLFGLQGLINFHLPFTGNVCQLPMEDKFFSNCKLIDQTLISATMMSTDFPGSKDPSLRKHYGNKMRSGEKGEEKEEVVVVVVHSFNPQLCHAEAL